MIVFLEKLEKKVDSKNHGVKIQKPMICAKQWAKGHILKEKTIIQEII